ncbi:MAG: hypothetical protein Q8L14_11865 [Myxococcales bacterium]|nr:hypothetical protein [Myxococcales bacterium]
MPKIARPNLPRSNKAQINARFDEARKPSSEAGTKVSAAELRDAARIAARGGTSGDDKVALRRNWENVYSGAGTDATAAAQKEYGKLNARFSLGYYR